MRSWGSNTIFPLWDLLLETKGFMFSVQNTFLIFLKISGFNFHLPESETDRDLWSVSALSIPGKHSTVTMIPFARRYSQFFWLLQTKLCRGWPPFWESKKVPPYFPFANELLWLIWIFLKGIILQTLLFLAPVGLYVPLFQTSTMALQSSDSGSRLLKLSLMHLMIQLFSFEVFNSLVISHCSVLDCLPTKSFLCFLK